MRYLIVFIALLCVTDLVWAFPNVEQYLDIEGGRVYRDHVKSSLFYLSPSAPVLGRGQDGLPGYGLEIYRYLGRKGTGDSGKFRVKGVLNIDIERQRGDKQLKKIKKALSKQLKIKHPKLRSMPVAKTEGRLLFADTDIKWSQTSRWSGKKITLALDAVTGQILWDAVEAGQTLISVEMEESLVGVKKSDDPGSGKKWEEALVPAGFTLPVTLDMAKYPSCFSKVDLGGRMVRGYTGMDVFCFDFLEHLDENLYSKVVEVAIPTPGKSLVESVTFNNNSSYRTRITFKLAKDLDTGYKVRIIRIFMDGSRKTDPWTLRMGEAMLDVTDYKADDTAGPDEQMEELRIQE